jgi:cyclase
VDRRWIHRVAEVLDIPFCVAGGIRSIRDAEEVLNFGADKVSINTPALSNPALITDLARRFGTQCVVVGIDSREEAGSWYVYQFTGDPEKTRAAGLKTRDWIVEAQHRGAGEIVLNCMNQDGVRRGYDLVQLKAMRAVTTVPLIASGGAGAPEHFREVFVEAGVDGALAASVFHSGTIHIGTLKTWLRGEGIEVRP